MMRAFVFAGRNTKEILRDKLTLFFGLIFPLVILTLMALIGRSVPADIFPIGDLAPGIAVFGLSFLSLFGGLLIAKDRSGAFMARLLSSPMRASDFILGYLLPLIPIGLCQSLICLLVSALFGLRLSLGTPLAAIVLVPMSLFYISTGLFLGGVLTEKQIGGVCGALITNLSAWLSGVWFDPALVGGAFEKITDFFPFIHASVAAKMAVDMDFAHILPHLAVTIAWAAAMFIAAVATLRHSMTAA